MGALNIPSAADIERLTRRLRSVSQRLEGIEDALDRLEERLARRLRAGGDAACDARGPARRDRRATSPRSATPWRPDATRAARAGAPDRREPGS